MNQGIAIRRQKSDRDWENVIKPFMKKQNFSDKFLEELYEYKRIQEYLKYETFTVKVKHQHKSKPWTERLLDRIEAGSDENPLIIQAYIIPNSVNLRAWGIISGQLLAKLHFEGHTKYPTKNRLESAEDKTSEFKYIDFKSVGELCGQYDRKWAGFMYWLESTDKIAYIMRGSDKGSF